MTQRDTSADAFADAARGEIPGTITLTLSTSGAAHLLGALTRADRALQLAERAKAFTITRPCREARVEVQRAWAVLTSKIKSAVPSQ